jgi:2-amino-4-hydroxy-6-hydroxymethyldihydropteridine diphosphokinase
MHDAEGTDGAGGWHVMLGLGANVGQPLAQLARALDLVRGTLDGLRVSSVYRSAPIGNLDQPDFYNVVCSGATRKPPAAVMSSTREIERMLGRVRTVRNAPRTIDLDILAYGDLVLDTPDLTLPHPRLHQRAFVLVPLAEVAPDWRHPVLNMTAQEMLVSGGPFERIEPWGELRLDPARAKPF